MNREKAQEAINSIVLKNRLARQYPAGKKQLAELKELGLIDLMPICKHPSVRAIGHTDAKLVLDAAKDSGKPVGGFNAYGEGDVVNSKASALYAALNEDDNTEEDDDGAVEVDRIEADNELYIVYRDGSEYTVDAEWSDGPAWIGDHMPTREEVETLHTDYMQTVANQDKLTAVEDALYAKRQASLNDVMTASEVAQQYGLAEATVRQAINRGVLPARKSAGTWLILRGDAENKWNK